MKTLLLVLPLVASTTAFFGCSSPSAGSRPHDGGMDVSPPHKDAHPIDYYCAADAMGGGVCPINFCGTLQTTSSLPGNAYGQSGADSICNSGRVCIVGAPVPAGDAFQLTCVAPVSGALAFGAACSTSTAGMHCADDSLCIASPDFPTQPFCSTMCRNDADCPSSSSCLEYQTVTASNGSAAKVGYCTPSSKIAASACGRESACPAGQGCVPYGTRTGLTVCKAPASGGAKTVGQACSGNADCLSGACFDRQFRLNGLTNRTYCSSVCAVNSDCGPDQMCTRLVQNNNGTPSDPTDDVVTGECQTLFIPIGASGCGGPDGGSGDDYCVALNNGSNACDLVHGLCYNKSAVPGSPCTADTGCMLGGICSGGTRFPGGYCQTFGCAPNPTASTPAVDLCAGAGSACVQRGAPDAPIHACYDGCQIGADAGALMCLRAGFVCSSPAANQPASICLGQTGT